MPHITSKCLGRVDVCGILLSKYYWTVIFYYHFYEKQCRAISCFRLLHNVIVFYVA